MFDLYPFQVEGVRRLLSMPHKGMFLTDEMGVGKSSQAIGISNLTCPTSTLILAPKSLLVNWQREFTKFDYWGIMPQIVTTKNVPDSPYLVCNYDIIHKVRDQLPKHFDLVICDESHYGKTPESKRSIAMRRFCLDARSTLLMTGTPLENCPVELWHQLVCLGWIPEDSYDKYVTQFCDKQLKRIYMAKPPRNRWGVKYDTQKKRWYREVWDVRGNANLLQLKALLEKYGMVRRTKAEVLPDLPPKTYQTIELPRLTKWRSNLMRDVFGIPAKRGESQLKYFDRLSSVAKKTGNNKHLVDTLAEARKLDGVDKVKQALEFIENSLESEQKVVVFAWHTEVLEALQEGLKKHNAVCIQGATSQTKRQEAIDSFQEDPNTRVFIGQIKAAGVGITLTAATHVIFVELEWVPGLLEQACDRCHRNGQKGNVLVQYLVFEDSTDQRVAASLIEKQKTLSAVLDEEPLDVSDMSWSA